MDPNELDSFLEIFDVEFPDSVLNELKVLFIDGDSNSWVVNNLDYCFKNGPVECPFYSGYYYIPCFSRYALNKEGVIVTIKTGYRKKWSVTKPVPKKNITGGYFYTNLISDKGRKQKIAKRHRLLCLTFKHPGHPVTDLVVNHDDGIPGNDELNNIDFCTYSQNTQHAYDNGLHAKKTTPVVVKSWITGKEQHCDSVVQASAITKTSDVALFHRLHKSNGVRYPDGWRVKRPGDEWEPMKVMERQSDRDVEVICRNVFTNEILIFGRIAEAAKYTNVRTGTIQAQVTRESFRPIDGWNFRKLQGFEGFPRFSDKQIAIFKENPIRPGAGIDVFDRNKNVSIFFTSVANAADYFGISPVTVNRIAKRNGVKDNRYEFKLIGIDNANSPLSE